MAFSPTTDKKKNRLSNMFGSKRESHNPNTTTTSAGAMYNDERPSNADSAYASSEGPSTSDSRGEMVHVENHNDDRNLSKNMTTGEVFDEDTGEVVTTTTTTTTTTTVVSKGGKKVQHVSVATQPHEQQSTIAEAPGDNQHLSPSTAAAHPSQRDASHSPVSHSPQAPPAYPQQQPQQQYNNPSIPHRNPNRKSREISDEQRSQYYDDGLGRYPGIPGQQQQQQQPVSPTSQYPGKGNFSYPSRSSDNLRMREDGGHGGGTGSGVGAKGTFENLKAAAVGIHGVGETLRGTLNSGIDSRFPISRNAEKNAAINARNQAVLEKGDREMAGLRNRGGLVPTISPPQPPPPTQTQGVTGSGNTASENRYPNPNHARRPSGPESAAAGTNTTMGRFYNPAIAPDHDTSRHPAERPNMIHPAERERRPSEPKPPMGNSSTVQALSQTPGEVGGGKEEKKGGFRKFMKKSLAA